MNRELSDSAITSIEFYCDKWGYFAKISKLQILIIDKQLTACHHETVVHKEGRIINSLFELSKTNFVTFAMAKLRITSKILPRQIISYLYIFGNLLGTPDNSKNSIMGLVEFYGIN
jgi:hypothetical protein